MGAFEELLRKTLQQQGGQDAQSREKIYQSARAALGRLLEKQQGLSAEQIAAQKDGLERSIRSLEIEYSAKNAALEAMPSVAPRTAPVAPVAPVAAPTPAPEPAPTPAPSPVTVPRAEPVARVATSSPDASPIAMNVPGMGRPVKVATASTPVKQAPIAPSQTENQPQPQVQASQVPQRNPSPVQNQPKLNIPSLDGNGASDDFAVDDQNKKHPFAKLMLWSTLGAFLVLGAWWVYEQQLFVPLSVRDGAVPNPEQSLESEDFTPSKSGDANTDAVDKTVAGNGTKPINPIDSFPKVTDDYKTDEKGWIDVLNPNDPRGVILNDRGTAELLTEDGKKILRLRSFKQADTADQSERAIKIEIGNGLAKSLAGKTVDLLLEMRSSDNDKHKISVVCAFGALGQCGRRWYQVNPKMKSVLIEFELQKGDAQTGSNFLLIYTDDENMGKGVDIYGIKIMAKTST